MSTKSVSRIDRTSEAANGKPTQGKAVEKRRESAKPTSDAATQARPLPAGLDVGRIRMALALSREHLARVMGVSAKTILRWEAEGALPADTQQRALLAQVQEIAALGTTVYTPKGLKLFLETPLPAFGNRSALQLLEQGQVDRVRAELISDLEGAGF